MYTCRILNHRTRKNPSHEKIKNKQKTQSRFPSPFPSTSTLSSFLHNCINFFCYFFFFFFATIACPDSSATDRNGNLRKIWGGKQQNSGVHLRVSTLKQPSFHQKKQHSNKLQSTSAPFVKGGREAGRGGRERSQKHFSFFKKRHFSPPPPLVPSFFL